MNDARHTQPHARSHGPNEHLLGVTGLDFEATGWMRHAACVGHDALPWTEQGRPHRLLVEAMQRICARCPVRPECAQYAVHVEATTGWWAGHNLNGFTCENPPTADALGLVPDLPRDDAA